jgi:hypothetical protein
MAQSPRPCGVGWNADGPGYAYLGMGALSVSKSVADLVTIGSEFFVTLPASLVGFLSPRNAGLVLLAAATIAEAGLLLEDPRAAAVFLVLCTPSAAVGGVLVLASSRLGAA